MKHKKKKKDIDIQSSETSTSPEAAAEFLAGVQGEPADDQSEAGKYKAQAEENFKLYQYSMAELENLKKRTIADRQEMRKYGVIPFAKDILHVVDNLERALDHLETADKDSLTKGIQMTLDEFNKALNRHGIHQVSAVGKFFDPNIHEGFIMIETNTYSPNTVIEEFEKGYMLDDRLVRAAKVSVSVEKREEASAEGASEQPVEGSEEETDLLDAEIVEE